MPIPPDGPWFQGGGGGGSGSPGNPGKTLGGPIAAGSPVYSNAGGYVRTGPAVVEFELGTDGMFRQGWRPETHLTPQQARRDVETYLAQLQALPPGTMVLPLPLIAARDAIEQCKAMLYDMDQAGIYSSRPK